METKEYVQYIEKYKKMSRKGMKKPKKKEKDESEGELRERIVAVPCSVVVNDDDVDAV